MITSRRYSRSPITEAIIDFQVELPEGVGVSELEHCQDAAYPGKQTLTATLPSTKLHGRPVASGEVVYCSQQRRNPQ